MPKPTLTRFCAPHSPYSSALLREAACLYEWQKHDGREYDYIYISKARIRIHYPALGHTIPVLNALLETGDFELIYDNAQTAIIKKK